MLGRVLPCEYEFECEPYELDASLAAWAAHNGMEVAPFDGPGCFLAMPPYGRIGWHIMPISFFVERLEPDDSIDSTIDQHLIERVIMAIEMLAQPFQH